MGPYDFILIGSRQSVQGHISIAVEIVNLCNSIKGNSALANQLIRSGTAIGTNIHEANYAHGKAVIAKLQIALKECYETEYWLELFSRTNIIGTEHPTAIKNRETIMKNINEL